MIRLGDEYKVVNYSRNKGKIAIGWPELDNLSAITSRDQLKLHYQRVYSNSTAKNISINANQIFSFVHEMQVGDYILVSDISKEEFYLGLIKGSYSFKFLDSNEKPHTRNVQWLGHVNNSSISELSEISHSSEFNILRIDSFLSKFDTIASEIMPSEKTHVQ